MIARREGAMSGKLGGEGSARLRGIGAGADCAGHGAERGGQSLFVPRKRKSLGAPVIWGNGAFRNRKEGCTPEPDHLGPGRNVQKGPYGLRPGPTDRAESRRSNTEIPPLTRGFATPSLERLSRARLHCAFDETSLARSRRGLPRPRRSGGPHCTMSESSTLLHDLGEARGYGGRGVGTVPAALKQPVGGRTKGPYARSGVPGENHLGDPRFRTVEGCRTFHDPIQHINSSRSE